MAEELTKLPPYPTSNNRFTTITFYKQYATYQADLEVFSDVLSTDDVFKKTFLYIMQWLKRRIGEEQMEAVEELHRLREYPEPEAYKTFDTKEMYGFKQLDMLDVRMFYLAEEKSWALKITEPDNRAEFSAGNMEDADKIHGRSFITDVALREKESSVSLAIEIKCKEPIYNERLAVSFRPAFVKSLFVDEELQLIETGVGRAWAYGKCADKSGHCSATPWIVDSEEQCQFIREELLQNPVRQMPVLLCPEEILSERQPMKYNVDGTISYIERDYANLAMNMVAYGYMVIVRKSYYELLFPVDENGNREEYYHRLADGYCIVHTAYDEGDGTPREPFYCLLHNDEWEEDGKKRQEPSSFEALMEHIHQYAIGKQYFHRDVWFYRQLKKHYFSLDANRKITLEAYESLQHEWEETMQKLNGELAINQKLRREVKENQNLIEEKRMQHMQEINGWKEKVSDAQKQCQSLIKKEKEFAKDFNNLRHSQMPEASEEVMRAFQVGEMALLFPICQYSYEENKSLFLMIRSKLIYSLQCGFARFSEEQKGWRRYDILLNMLQYHAFLKREGRYLQESYLYYPTALELYPGEFVNVLYDELYQLEDETGVLEDILLDNDFDMKQEEVQKRMKDELPGCSTVKEVKRFMKEQGFEDVSDKNHLKFAYYGKSEYLCTLACTPSDRRAMKNVAHDIVNQFL